MARLIRIALGLLACGAITLLAYGWGEDYVRRHPQDVPWTELQLNQPVGIFTLRKLADLGEEPSRCQRLLEQATTGDEPVPPRRDGLQCGYANGVRLRAAEGEAQPAPAGVVASCPVAAALVIFERQILQPAASRHLGQRITSIIHAGSYSCRRLYGRSEGPFSEHATANAIDITGFGLADGSSVNVLRDWDSPGPKGQFLREIHKASCRLFATALSPDYNDAHADHLHLDQAQRGASGYSVCR